MKRFVSILTTVFLFSILQPGLQTVSASMSKAMSKGPLALASRSQESAQSIPRCGSD
jgi:hypothetical protein